MGVGRRLREARDAKGLTLTAVAERTKIPPRQLSLLENEEYDRLPGGIFARGHVRAVAAALGLDADPIVAEFRQELQPSPPPRRQASAEIFDTGPESLRLRLAPEHVSAPDERSHGRALALVLLAVSVILVILWLRREGPAVPDTGAELPGAVVEIASTREFAGSGMPGAVGTSGALPAGVATDGQPLIVRVEAEAPCWIALQADGARVAYRLFQAGDSVTAEARQEILLRTGNAAALHLTINGMRARRIGSSGEVRTIQITPENYRTVLGGPP